MKRGKREQLLAYVLWCSILLAYGWSFFLPWFEFGGEKRFPLLVFAFPFQIEPRPQAEPRTEKAAALSLGARR